ncbi:F-box only protein 40 [Stegostoma tigrinum]|uniref:F-box only protein 40 n=1 Tax=Stegostoma tigrinum TaxID=3053191 RepID=UPI002870548E|nr:F-box only protein 40 [Stegostoma tigrinum]XP_048396586.2 F-box only protein 40 [Stegostoma tigrinum]XP_048396587.2 F-box only protein 40 [Stegostoma tigrinum]
MIRNRNSTSRLHKHCEKCYNRHCNKTFEPAVSCLVITCSSKCGAVFHQCKEDEHTLLCPLEQVPCLNSAFGCPFVMARHKLSKHLYVCPASIVCCSMQWNRWPANEDDIIVNKSAVKDSLNPEDLDFGTAMTDQRILFNSVKLAELFPEMAEPVDENELDLNEEGAVGGQQVNLTTLDGNFNETGTEINQDGLDQVCTDVAEMAEPVAESNQIEYLSMYSTWEHIFSKDKGGFASEQKIEKAENKHKNEMSSVCTKSKTSSLENKTNIADPGLLASIEKTGEAPWQEGVLERLETQMDRKHFNMYLVHHGSMLIRFGQMSACTPKEKDFVYGKLEAQEVRTVNTFKVPTSYRAKRGHIGETLSSKIKKENKAVDTSDLDTEACYNDEVTISLLCYLENVLKGHIISERKVTDGLTIDFATQTYSFPSSPFSRDVTLADVAADKTSRLYLQLQTECITKRYNKLNSAFTFMCYHFFRRDEFSSHFRNVHADIQSGLNGWMVQRCPLAYLGCSYSQTRFCPSRQKAKVIYNQHQSTFAVKPNVPAVLCQHSHRDSKVWQSRKSGLSLSTLPSEILRYIASFLDSYSLAQLSQVSVLMNAVSSTLLQEHGMVFLVWEKKSYSHGSFSWRARKRRWQFSSVFSTVDSWRFNDNPSIAEHLKTCPYYMTESKTKPVALISMCMSPELKQEKKNLVTMFSKKKNTNRFSNLIV